METIKELSSIASQVQASTTLAVDSLYKEMRAAGLDVVGFGAGEPDFDTPDNIRAAGIRAIQNGETRYTPAAGIAELRKAAAARLNADCGLNYDYTQIVVASGAKHALFAALMALLNPGDEAVVPAPYWVTYTEAVKMAGAVPVVIATEETASFKMTPEQLAAAITPRTKLLLLNNPSNPTGMLYSRDELEAIAQICVQNDLYVIADEIYYNLVYDGREFVSFASLGGDLAERTVVVNGVSKSYAMTGWRIGYTASSPAIAKVIANYLSHSTGAPGTMAQFAAVEALSGPQDGIAAMREVFEQRRNYIVERVNNLEGVSCTCPDGAFYIMINIEQQLGKTLGGRLIQDADDFSMALLEKGLVAMVSCSGFGAPKFVRMTYTSSMDDIREGLDRLERFLRA